MLRGVLPRKGLAVGDGISGIRLALLVQHLRRHLAEARVGVHEEVRAGELHGTRHELAAPVRHHSREPIASERRHAHREVPVHAIREHAPRRIVLRGVAARAHVVEPQTLVLDRETAGDVAHVAGIPCAAAPARLVDRGRAVRTREMEPVARVGEVDRGRLGHAGARGLVVLVSAENLEESHHDRLVRHGVHVVELGVRVDLPVQRARQVGVVAREPERAVHGVRLRHAAPRREVPAAARVEVAVRVVDARAVAPVRAQAPDPLAEERVVEHRRAVVVQACVAQKAPADAVARDVCGAARGVAARRDADAPIVVGRVRVVAGEHAERVGPLVGQHDVVAVASHGRTFPDESVLRLRQADASAPARHVPHAETPPRGIPPHAAARHAAPRRRLVHRIPITPFGPLGERLVAQFGVQCALGPRLRPHHGIPLVLDGLAERTHDAVRRFNQEIVHEQLSPEVDRNHLRDVVRLKVGRLDRILVLRVNLRRPFLRQHDAVVERAPAVRHVGHGLRRQRLPAGRADMRLVGLQELGGRQHAIRDAAAGERAGNNVPAASAPAEGEPSTAFELTVECLDGTCSRRLTVEIEAPFGLARRRAMRERERETMPAVRERVRVGDGRQQRVARAGRSRENLPGKALVDAVAAEREEPAAVAPERARHHPRFAFARQAREAIPTFQREVVRGCHVASRHVAVGEVARLFAARRHQRRASVAQLADVRHVAHKEVVCG